MRLLVTGGAGFVGSTVTTLLVEAGHEVTVLDDLSSGHESAVPDGVSFIKARVQDAADDVLGSATFDGVLHFAGFIEVAEMCRSRNGTGTTMSAGRCVCWTRCTVTASVA